MNLNPILPIVGFQLVWLTCAFGAARDQSWPGLLAVILMLAMHFSGASDRRQAGLVVLAAAIVGFVVESLLVANQWLTYGGAWPSDGYAPAWVAGLWAAFGATLGITNTVLGQRWRVAAVLGFCLAPVAYFAGAQIGALEVASPQWLSFLIIALIWACVWPTLLILYGRLQMQ